MSDNLQEYTQDLCDTYNVSYSLVLAIITVESGFRAGVTSKTNDFGLMQINRINHDWLRSELGIADFLDAKENILAGIFMLSTISARCDDTAYIIMAYNMGHSRAWKLYCDGVRQGVYLDKVVTAMESLEIRRN